MTTETPRDERARQLRDAEIAKMPRCKRCNLSYMPQKSTSALKLTYCSFLCELGDLGFSMAGLETMTKPDPAEATSDEESESREPAGVS